MPSAGFFYHAEMQALNRIIKDMRTLCRGVLLFQGMSAGGLAKTQGAMQKSLK